MPSCCGCKPRAVRQVLAPGGGHVCFSWTEGRVAFCPQGHGSNQPPSSPPHQRLRAPATPRHHRNKAKTSAPERCCVVCAGVHALHPPSGTRGKEYERGSLPLAVEKDKHNNARSRSACVLRCHHVEPALGMQAGSSPCVAAERCPQERVGGVTQRRVKRRTHSGDLWFSVRSLKTTHRTRQRSGYGRVIAPPHLAPAHTETPSPGRHATPRSDLQQPALWLLQSHATRTPPHGAAPSAPWPSRPVSMSPSARAACWGVTKHRIHNGRKSATRLFVLSAPRLSLSLSLPLSLLPLTRARAQGKLQRSGHDARLASWPTCRLPSTRVLRPGLEGGGRQGGTHLPSGQRLAPARPPAESH